jgi:predicted AlkP superfamily pyrophosphatase or phosphodiesterase
LKLLILAFALAAAVHAQRPVLMVSVDGLDARYLNDAGRLGLKIPNLRRIVTQGQSARGVIGVVPTVTWPSHTTLISGVPPSVHGILGNRRPRDEGGDYYWSASLLKARTLLDTAKAAGKSTAAITWPVTVDAPLTYNLPEYFQKRRGGAMDLPSIASKSVPAGLQVRISSMFPSFAQEWMDDRTRTLATRYLLRVHKPDLLLVHLVDLDSEAHETGPFSTHANAVLEYIDELIGTMLADLPQNYVFVLVSDHGFERIDREVNLKVIASKQKVDGLRSMGGIAVADTPQAAALLRSLSKEAQYGIGREIPPSDVKILAPSLAMASAVFESAPHYWFGSGEKELHSKPHETGAHGHWPGRYRAVFAAWGTGVKPQRLEEIMMTIASHRGLPPFSDYSLYRDLLADGATRYSNPAS